MNSEIEKNIAENDAAKSGAQQVDRSRSGKPLRAPKSSPEIRTDNPA
jgi:hypothetical protein